MIYMVEMEFRNPAREADWHVWYLGHIAKLIRNVPGFRASQRFRAITPTPRPGSPCMTWCRAPCSRAPTIAPTAGRPLRANGRPSTPTGIATCSPASTTRPEVPPGAHLLMLEGAAKVPAPYAATVIRLESAGLDRTSKGRGIAVVPAGRLTAGLFDIPGVRIFQPISPRISQ